MANWTYLIQHNFLNPSPHLILAIMYMIYNSTIKALDVAIGLGSQRQLTAIAEIPDLPQVKYCRDRSITSFKTTLNKFQVLIRFQRLANARGVEDFFVYKYVIHWQSPQSKQQRYKVGTSVYTQCVWLQVTFIFRLSHSAVVEPRSLRPLVAFSALK